MERILAQKHLRNVIWIRGFEERWCRVVYAVYRHDLSRPELRRKAGLRP